MCACVCVFNPHSPHSSWRWLRERLSLVYTNQVTQRVLVSKRIVCHFSLRLSCHFTWIPPALLPHYIEVLFSEASHKCCVGIFQDLFSCISLLYVVMQFHAKVLNVIINWCRYTLIKGQIVSIFNMLRYNFMSKKTCKPQSVSCWDTLNQKMNHWVFSWIVLKKK